MSEQQKGRFFVALAAVAWSTAGLLQRELSVDTATQVAGRALFAAVGLAVYVAAVERGGTIRAFRAIGVGGLAVVALLAAASASFLVALNHASVANVLFMQALAPILAAALGTLIGDAVERRTWVAMAIAVVGVGVMVGGPGRSTAPATLLSQLLVLAVFGPFASTGSAGAEDLALLAALGITQIGLGFVFLTIGGRLIPAGEVALITLLEIVLGPLWVWTVLSERPSAATLAGGAIVLAAVLLEARARPAPAQPGA